MPDERPPLSSYETEQPTERPPLSSYEQASLTGREIAADVAKSAGVGVGQGLIGLAGTPGDVGSYLNRGVDWALGKAADVTGIEALRPDEQPEREGGPMFGSQQIQHGVESVTGPFYEPQTWQGRSARNIADVATQSVPFGPMRGALYAGVGSEALGKAAETLAPAAEPYARFAGGFLGGARGSYAAERAGAEATRKQLLNIDAPFGTKALYKSFDAIADNVPVDWKLAAQIKNTMRAELQTVTHDTSLAEKLVTKFAPTTVKDLRIFRSDARDALYSKGMGQSAQALTRAIDAGIEAALPKTPGKPGPLELLRSADRQFALTKLAQGLERRIAVAEQGTAATHSGLNLDNKVRQALAAFKKDERAWHSLTDGERAHIDAIIEGTRGVNTLRGLANFFGGGGGLGAFVAGSVGHYIVPGWGWGTPILGRTLKHFENKMTENAARNLLADVAGRSLFAVDTMRPSALRISSLPWRSGRAAIYGGLAPQTTSEGYPYYQGR